MIIKNGLFIFSIALKFVGIALVAHGIDEKNFMIYASALVFYFLGCVVGEMRDYPR